MLIGISRIHYPVTVLGYGRRVGIWVQGCSIRCHGCVSVDTWATAHPGLMVPVSDVLEAISAAGREQALDGVTISGGEPFDQPEALDALLKGLADLAWPSADVLVYSGYEERVLRERFPHIVQMADALVAGPFVSGNTASSLMGSDNQRLVLVSDLGRARYGARNPDQRGRFQVVAADGSVWMIGIPQNGGLGALRNHLRERGIEPGQVSWLS